MSLTACTAWQPESRDFGRLTRALQVAEVHTLRDYVGSARAAGAAGPPKSRHEIGERTAECRRLRPAFGGKTTVMADGGCGKRLLMLRGGGVRSIVSLTREEAWQHVCRQPVH